MNSEKSEFIGAIDVEEDDNVMEEGEVGSLMNMVVGREV